MLKALLRKDFMRLMAFFKGQGYTKLNKKKKAQPSKSKGGVGMIILWVFVFISIAFAFSGVGEALGATLFEFNMDWLYYAILCMLGFILNIFLNGFMASSVLFNATDNEMLLSMPIPPAYILFSRMTGLITLGFIYSLMATLPAFIIRCLLAGFSVAHLLGMIFTTIMMAFSATAVSALLGWIISWLQKRFKNKSLVSVLFVIVVLGGYYYFQFNANKYVMALAENSLGIGAKIEGSLFGYPLYQCGMAMTGDIKGIILSLLLTAVFFGIVYYVLSKKFISIVTKSEKTSSVQYNAKKQETVKLVSPRKALLAREFKRFTSSAVYMLNCGLGIIFDLAAIVVVIIKGPFLKEQLDLLASLTDSLIVEQIYSDFLPVGLLLVGMLLVSMVDTAAPSISLEGKTMWILQTMPTDPMDVFAAKAQMELYLAGIPVGLLMLVAGFVFGLDASSIVVILACLYMYVRAHAQLSLVLNLKMPNMDWTNEAIPIKQSMPVIIALLGGMILACGFGALYYFVLASKLSGLEFIVILMVIFALGVRYANAWLGKQGREIFAYL
ncbi:MAG: hypothetical protein MJ148_03450 [Clostridia bacterium]|nr:hypothetical protein [Clostridia bacterium]